MFFFTLLCPLLSNLKLFHRHDHVPSSNMSTKTSWNLFKKIYGLWQIVRWVVFFWRLRGLSVNRVCTIYLIRLNYNAFMYGGPMSLCTKFGNNWAKVEKVLWKWVFQSCQNGSQKVADIGGLSNKVVEHIHPLLFAAWTLIIPTNTIGYSQLHCLEPNYTCKQGWGCCFFHGNFRLLYQGQSCKYSQKISWQLTKDGLSSLGRWFQLAVADKSFCVCLGMTKDTITHTQLLLSSIKSYSEKQFFSYCCTPLRPNDSYFCTYSGRSTEYAPVGCLCIKTLLRYHILFGGLLVILFGYDGQTLMKI